MPDTIGINLNLKLLAASQYGEYNFNSLCKFGDHYLGVNETGLFKLGSEGYTQTVLDRDHTASISAVVELSTTDFGTDLQKRIRSLYAGYQTNGKLKLTIKNDDGNAREYVLSPVTLNKAHSNKVPVGRDGKGRYWTFKIENVNGSYFELKSLTALLVLLSRGRFQ